MFNHFIGLSYWGAIVGFQYYVVNKFADANKLDDYFKRTDDLI